MYILLLDTFTQKAYRFQVPADQQSEETEEVITQLGFNLANVDWMSSNEEIHIEYLDAKNAVEEVKKLINENQ